MLKSVWFTIILFLTSRCTSSKAKDDNTKDIDVSDSEVTDDRDEEGIPKPDPEMPEMQVGVTHFLTGVVPAGSLRARKKRPARWAYYVHFTLILVL